MLLFFPLPIIYSTNYLTKQIITMAVTRFPSGNRKDSVFTWNGSNFTHLNNDTDTFNADTVPDENRFHSTHYLREAANDLGDVPFLEANIIAVCIWITYKCIETWNWKIKQLKYVRLDFVKSIKSLHAPYRPWGPFCKYGLTLIPEWISNHTAVKCGIDLLIHPQTSTVNFIPHFIMHAITYPCWDQSYRLVCKRVPSQITCVE